MIIDNDEQLVKTCYKSSKKIYFDLLPLPHMENIKCGVIIFPGSNCDKDLIEVLENVTQTKVIEIWHKNTDLSGCTHIFLPGGFSYGDYLRSGAIAKLSPVMEAVAEHAKNGGFVMGICNGFQILCESGLLPGALLHNDQRQFICSNVFIKANNNNNLLTSKLDTNKALKIPIAHGEGNYYADEATISKLQSNGQIVFEYCDANGNVNKEGNPNGSMLNIAGICNETKNVFGMMPHPERAASSILSNTDGLSIFENIFNLHLA